MVHGTQSSSGASAAAMERSKGKGKGKEKRQAEKEQVETQLGSANKFFRIFLPVEQSGDRLNIPAQFQELLEESPNASRPVSLKGPSGNTWEVELVSDAQGVGFTKGWKKFTVDHCLMLGHLLVFTYDGHSQFWVVVFRPSGVQDKLALNARPSEEDDADDIHSSFMEGMEPNGRRSTSWKGAARQANAATKDVGAAGTLQVSALDGRPSNKEDAVVKQEQEDDVADDVNSSFMEDVEPYGRRSTRKGATRQANAATENIGAASALQVSANAVTKRPRQASCDVMEDAAPKRDSSAQINKSGKRKSQANTSSAALTNAKAGRYTHCDTQTLIKSMDVTRIGTFVSRKSRQPEVISQRRLVTEEEKKRAIERAKKFTSKNPFAVQVMLESHVYVGFFMTIPRRFVKDSLPRASKKMTLWDPQGKSWDVNYLYYDRSVAAFSGGWGKFALGNNLEKFDVCVFELFKEDNIAVQIYRVVPEITPLIIKSSV